MCTYRVQGAHVHSMVIVEAVAANDGLTNAGATSDPKP